MRDLLPALGLDKLTLGNVAVISNSGGLLLEIMTYGTARGLGFSHIVSSGNEAVVLPPPTCSITSSTTRRPTSS